MKSAVAIGVFQLNVPSKLGTVQKYEVSSIKNANLSIKYELIKLKKFQIARKKGINVVVRFQYSEISWD